MFFIREIVDGKFVFIICGVFWKVLIDMDISFYYRFVGIGIYNFFIDIDLC